MVCIAACGGLLRLTQNRACPLLTHGYIAKLRIACSSLFWFILTTMHVPSGIGTALIYGCSSSIVILTLIFSSCEVARGVTNPMQMRISRAATTMSLD